MASTGKDCAFVIGATTYPATALREFKPNSIKAAAVDSTTYGSTAKESIPEAIPDNGKATYQIIYDVTNPPAVGVQGTVKHQYHYAGVQYVGSGFIEECQPQIEINKLVVANITVVNTGAFQYWPV